MPAAPTVPTPAVVVTGRGVVCAIGSSVAQFEARLESAAGGIVLHHGVFRDCPIYAGLATPFENIAGLEKAAPEGCDQTARMAAAAMAQALREAALWDGVALAVPGDRVALLLGTSHGGRSQLDRFVEAGMDADDRDLALGVMDRAAHHHQAAVVATLFQVHGPVITFSTACSSSGMAIAHGLDLLRSGRADVAIVGGADAFSKLTYAGFKALGAVANGPCGPFGETIGMTLGEGAAFVVLERRASAEARGVGLLGELLGCGTSWDAYHLTTPEPSGEGMHRAMADALSRSGARPVDVDYVNAHATGTRANDISETLAIKRTFANSPVPPVSATKSFTGHTLGASSAMGLLASLGASRAGRLPPSLGIGSGRHGCDLDYVANASRAASVQRFMALSAAFGGANCAIAGGWVGLPHQPERPPSDGVVVTGMGVITPLGCTPSAVFEAVLAGHVAGDDAAAPGVGGTRSTFVPVAGFDPRRQLPFGKTPRMNRITQYAVAAMDQALTAAGLPASTRHGPRIGLMVGLSRGAAASFQAYLESVRGGQWNHASPTAFPNLVMSSVGGQAALALGLKGAASTVVGGADVAFALLAVACECLLANREIDAIVVVAADEVTPLYLRLDQARRGGAAPVPPAEGAVALVLERRERACQRGAPIRARISGWAQSFDAAPGPALDESGVWLERSVREALARAGTEPDRIDLVLTLARAEPAYDRREASILARLFGDTAPPVTAVTGHTGLAEAMSGLHAVATAISAVETGLAPAPAGPLAASRPASWDTTQASGAYAQALVMGSGAFGGNGALVLRRCDGATER